MNSQQIREAILSAREGNQKAYADLLTQYANLISSLVSRYSPADATDADREDMRQEANVSFCNAVQSYALSQDGVEFGLYAKICMTNALISASRVLARRGKNCLLTEQVPQETQADDPLDQMVADENFSLLYRRVRESLTEYENQVWWLYVMGESAARIAEHLGKDEKSVTNAVYRVRNKLRRELTDENKI